MRALRQSLYREHLEEASFLYEHRRLALEDPSSTLADIAELEARAEAHLDGLFLGGEEARRICRSRADEGDFGELHGAIRIFCRTNQPADVAVAGAKVDAGDPERLVAMVDALRYELPASWTAQVKEWLTSEDAPPQLQAALAIAAGHRRLPLGTELLARAKTLKGPEVLPFIEALGQLREPAAAMLLFRFMQQPDHNLGRAASIAALRLQAMQVRPHLRQAISQFSWAPIPLALTAEKEMVASLLLLLRDDPSDDALIALGLLGDISVVDVLVSCLSDTKYAESAAVALYLITGAELPEVVEVPRDFLEDPAEDELANAGVRKRFADVSDEELQGEDDQHEELEPLIVTRHISQSPETWRTWLKSHDGQLRQGVRHRLGEPYSAQALMRCLTEYRLPLSTRRLVVDEIAIRFRVDVPYAPDMLAHEQLKALPELRSALEAATGSGVKGSRSVG